MVIVNKIDFSRIKLRLQNIRKNATDTISFVPSEVATALPEFYLSSTLTCLEDPNKCYPLHPENNELRDEWAIYAYDESARDYKALEGDLLFCSSSVIKMDKKYLFNLTAMPYFLTSMRKFKDTTIDGIRFTEDLTAEKNNVIIEIKKDSMGSIERHSIVLIDGPLIGENISTYILEMDEELRARDCIPLYFVKNSDSRLVIDSTENLKNDFNGDFHWAAKRLGMRNRSAYFRYTDEYKPRNSKVFAYFKPMQGFAQRVEMHSLTFEKYSSLMPSLMNLISYLYIAQGDYFNPQVRPIAIAELYAREGLKVINIPALLGKLGFHPSVNQVRFG